MGILKTIFGGQDSIKTMSYYALYQRLQKWRGDGVYPAKYSLPDAITFPHDFWQKVISLYKQTSSDAHERAISVFWVDGELVLTDVVRGGKSSVQSKNQIKIAYEPILRKGRYDYYKRKIWVDDKIYSQREVYHKKVPKKLDPPLYLFNMHTHPPHELNSGYHARKSNLAGDYVGQNAYGYWSAQDIRSLLSSGAVVTGLVTDIFHFLIRTSDTPASADSLNDGIVTKDYLADNMSIGVYEGRFGEKIVRQK